MKKLIIFMSFFLAFLSIHTGRAQTPAGHAEFSFYVAGSLLDASREGPGCQFCFFETDVVPQIIPFRESLGNSLMFGLTVGYYATERVALEGNFAIAPNHNLVREIGLRCPSDEVCTLVPESFFDFRQEEKIVAYHYDINVAYHFSTDSIRPYFLIGIGGVSYDLQGGFETNFAFNAGLGLKLYVNRLGLRVEVNEHIIPDHFLTDKTVANTQFHVGLIFTPF